MRHGVFAVDGLELLHLLADERHDSDSAQDVLTTQTWTKTAALKNLTF